MQPYLVRQGLAHRVVNADPATTPGGVVRIGDTPLRPIIGPAIDVAWTGLLLERAFVHRSDVPAWGHGLDHWTVGIPNYYA